MLSKFTFEPVSDWSEWDHCVNASPQGSLFFLSSYIKNTGVPSKAWYIKKGSSIRGGLCIQETKKGQECRLDDLVIHNGLWFASIEDKKLTRIRDERFEITEEVIAFLIEKYSTVELSLAPQFEDLRPFLWHNYHDPSGEKFHLSLRYTSFLKIGDLTGLGQGEEDCETFRQLEAIRQRNLRKAAKEEITCSTSGDIDFLLDSYQKTLEISEEEFRDKRQRMGTLIQSLCDQNMGSLYKVADNTGTPTYAVFFAWDEKRAYYLFGAGNSNDQASHHGTFAFWEALRSLANAYGITEVDWEGVNSPKRGWFKLTFGGALLPYYEIRWKSYEV